ncbi:hypothetical protein PTKIN_Ptkin19aG0074300 [Pterospermum kingtungense]
MLMGLFLRMKAWWVLVLLFLIVLVILSQSVLAAMGRSILSPDVAEALSFREALSCTKSLQLQSIIVESNALGVVTVINNNVVDGSVFIVVIFDCISCERDIRLHGFSCA